MGNAYVTYDEIDDAIASTDLLALAASQVAKKPAFWKWVIVAAQNGLQGAIVCALHDSVGVSVLTDKSARAILDWHKHHRGDCPPERLADFWTLFGRFCRQNTSLKESVTRQQIRDIHRLHRHFRNNFEHFTPKSWTIEKAGLPRIVGTAIDIIEIAMQRDKVTYRLTGNKIRHLKANIASARRHLAALIV
jgi:hypothetical protein